MGKPGDRAGTRASTSTQCNAHRHEAEGPGGVFLRAWGQTDMYLVLLRCLINRYHSMWTVLPGPVTYHADGSPVVLAVEFQGFPVLHAEPVLLGTLGPAKGELADDLGHVCQLPVGSEALLLEDLSALWAGEVHL